MRPGRNYPGTVAQPDISESTRLRLSGDQVSTDLGEEAVILHFEAGVYYGLEGVGARVWSLLRGEPAVGEICDAVVSEYDVDRERCEADVRALLEELVSAGLVELSDARPA